VNVIRKLRRVLRHPANRGRSAWVLRQWLRHQVEKRLKPQAPISRRVLGGVIVGPAAHPTICLATYCYGGLVDVDAFTTYSAILERGDHFLDIGAGIGLHAIAANRFTGPEGRIVCVEPDPSEQTWLSRTRTANGIDLEVLTQPVADRRRLLVWHHQSPTISHLRQPSHSAFELTIQTTTIDEIVADFALDPRRLFIKIDVEGWEPAVLVGGLTTIKTGVKGLWVEANGLQHRCNISWETAVDKIIACGYRPFIVNLENRCLELVPNPVPPVSPTDNYLFLPQETLISRLQHQLLSWERSLSR